MPAMPTPILALAALLGLAPASGDPFVLPMEDRARVRDEWLALRLDRVVPALMRREGIDMWLVVSREYNEDPVFKTMAPATWLAARRRTILLFHDPGDGPVERLAVSRYGVGEFFASAWNPEEQPDQWARLVELVSERDPAKIGLDSSETFALADGLSASEQSAFLERLPADLRSRVVSAERLAIGWLETRIEEELEAYPAIVRIAHEILEQGLSLQAVQPGVTTTDDLEWWFRERIRELRLSTWFHPSVSIQRAPKAEVNGELDTLSFANRSATEVIRPGDLIHVDFGITYLGLNTDTQQHAYVLRLGETAPPPGLVAALATGNRVQDALTGAFAKGRTGNEILALALEECRANGLEATIYTHPLGFHGHGAGPTIGLWDQQGGVPGRGDYPLHAGTTHSIELAARVHLPEWGTDIDIMLEEDALFDGRTVTYLDGRQTRLITIPRTRPHLASD